MISLESLDLCKACDEAVSLNPLDANGEELGIELLVLGAHSQAIQDALNKKINKQRAKQAIDARSSRRKPADYTPIEDDIQFGIESVAVRIAGWSGITEEYSPEMAIKLCTINPDICRQVREFSEDIGNFTKG